MKTLCIVQARMGSTRLPGKVLADIVGEPMLARAVQRVQKSTKIGETIVATSTLAADDAIANYCIEHNIPVFRGSENDVLDRFYQAAKSRGADIVVRVTADCPLIDPAVVDRVLEAFEAARADYASNVGRLTFPDGLDTEVFSFAALEAAWRDARKASEREHVTPYLRNPERFKQAGLEAPKNFSRERWTVDEPADLEFVRRVWTEFDGRLDFSYEDVLNLLDRKKEIRAMQGQFIANEGSYKSLYDEAVAGAAPKRRVEHSLRLLERAKKVIPGAAQTFSKGLSQHILGVSPLFLQRGKGCRVWDADGNEYIDYIQGLLPNILGYAHDEVNAAFSAQTAHGHSFSQPHPLEIELAERLRGIIPCAEMTRFGKNGSDATAGAVRAARAFTGRERVACCGYHGWQDWFIGSTTRNGGVPKAVCALTHPFPYNDLPKLDAVLSSQAGEFAAVILEPFNFTEPAPGFLEGVKALAHRHGALLIFDEICSGFHFGLGGAQKLFGVTPDLACFGKAMGNGFPISCIVGRADVMRIFEDIFVSFTFAGEVASMAAAMKVLDILETTGALADMESNGRILQDGFNALAKQAGLYPRFCCVGRPQWSLMKFRDASEKDSFLERSLWQQETVKRGVLELVTHNMSAAHDTLSVQRTLEVYAAVFKTLANWLNDSDPSKYLEGPMVQPVFRVR